MQCFVYKSLVKRDYFVYTSTCLHSSLDEQSINAENALPESLLNMLGELEFVVDFELNEQRYLVNANPREVMQAIDQQGYYLQFPSKAFQQEFEAIN